MTSERRSSDTPDHAPLRPGLTAAQADAIATLALFGWAPRFVRRPLFRDSVPVLVGKDGTRWILVDGDGALDEHPDRGSAMPTMH